MVLGVCARGGVAKVGNDHAQWIGSDHQNIAHFQVSVNDAKRVKVSDTLGTLVEGSPTYRAAHLRFCQYFENIRSPRFKEHVYVVDLFVSHRSVVAVRVDDVGQGADMRLRIG